MTYPASIVRRNRGGSGVRFLDAMSAIAARPAGRRPEGSAEPLVRLAAPDMAAVDKLITARMQSEVPVIPALADHLV